MDKKPLIGISILAVVFHVMGSLSNVLGHQSVKSTMNDSPLFQTKTKRATNQQQNSITSQYLGKGNLWNIPMSDNRNEQLKKVIEFISKMDDKTFERFTELLIRKVRQNNTLQGLSHYQIVQSLLLLKTNPDAVINSYTNRNNQDYPTVYGHYTLCGAWLPGCFILFFLSGIIFVFFFAPIMNFLNYFTLLWCDLP